MKYLATLICFLFLLSCKKHLHQINEITKIELGRSGAWFDSGATISIDSSLSYKYYGDYGDIKQGYFIGRISSKYWDTLNQKFENAAFKTFLPDSKILILDDAYFELVIYWKDGKRKITRYWDGGKEPIVKVFNWLSISDKRVKLKQVSTPFKFETTAHRPPRPKIAQVKFPPPTKR